MKNQDVLKSVKEIETTIRNSQEQLNTLIAELRQEEVIASLHKWKTISTSQLQRKFKMGYASSSTLIDNLLKKRLISRNSEGSNYKVIKNRK